MTSLSFVKLCRMGAAGLFLALAGACSALRPTASPPPSFYSLDSLRGEAGTARPAPVSVAVAGPTLLVNPPHAGSGFDSRRIIYVREPHKLEYFAHNEWVDTPARMLAPLVVAALEKSGSFRAVVLTPSAATGDLRLDTEIVRLQQDFGSPPSQARFTLRAYVVDNTTRRVLARREFNASVAAASEEPYAGVVAANRAVHAVLEQLAGFCTEVAADWQPPAADAPKRSAGTLPGR